MTDERRSAMLKFLADSQSPVTGAILSQKFQVSRQAIVQDIAVLRAAGNNIIAASNGYFLQKLPPQKLIRSISSSHVGLDRMEEELKIIVDFGGKVLNISVSHPLYGQITCPLIIGSREDIRLFIERLHRDQAVPLSVLTEGNHYHDIEVDSEKMFKSIYDKLVEKEFILE